MKRIPALVLAFAMTAALVFSAVGVDAVSEYEYCFGEDDFLTAGALPDGIYLTAVPTASFGSALAGWMYARIGKNKEKNFKKSFVFAKLFLVI